MNLDTFIVSVALRMKDTSYQLMLKTDYQDHVEAAVLEYSRFRPRHRKATLALVAGQADYAAPADWNAFLLSEWGKADPKRAPWDRPSSLAGVPAVFFVDGQIHLNPPPTAIQIATFAATYTYIYKASHVVDATSSTVPVQDEILVRLAALRSACKEIAADKGQSEAFVARYSRLAKRYGERFMELVGKPKAAIVRS